MILMNRAMNGSSSPRLTQLPLRMLFISSISIHEYEHAVVNDVAREFRIWSKLRTAHVKR